MKIAETILEVIGWLTIVIGVTIAASLVAFIVYLNWHGKPGSICAIILICAGFISGAIWATRIWKKQGTIAWLSQIRRIS